MKLLIVPGTDIHVVFRTRGEHRPPHVRVVNRQVPWEAKVRFSFVEDTDVAVLEVDPDRNWPSASTIRVVLAAIHADLAHVRQEWWKTFKTVCLEGKWVKQLPLVEGKPSFEVLKGHQKGAVRVQKAVFCSDTAIIQFALADDKTFEATAGCGRDLSDRD